MLRSFTRNNTTLVSIIIFLVIFGIVQMLQPSFLYNIDGSLREFGVGYKNKTILEQFQPVFNISPTGQWSAPATSDSI